LSLSLYTSRGRTLDVGSTSDGHTQV